MPASDSVVSAELLRPVIQISIWLFCLLTSSVSLFADDLLEGAISEVTNQSRFKHTHWGALFIDRESGEVVFSHAAEKLFAPASTTKLFSVACALDTLGAEHRFMTPVVRRGEVSRSGELSGDLILVASGDLSFDGRTLPDGKIAFQDADHTYANGNPDATLTDTDPLSGLNELAQQVFAAGIRHVRGEVLIDDRLFEHAESSGSGPSKVTPILINDNVIDFVTTPAELTQPAKVVCRPSTLGIQVESQVKTVAEDQPLQIVVHDYGHGRFSVRGQIPLNHKPVLRIHEVNNPNTFARTLFIECLRRKGVEVDANSLQENPAAVLPTVAEIKELPQVAVLRSVTFAESAKLILKVSHNLHASTLPLLVASQHGERTLAQGLKRQHEFLQRAGVDVQTISFSSAAGGGRGDFVTPKSAVQLLRYMADRPDFDVYLNALPILGIDGTLAKNVPAESPARGKVRAKTGTFYWENSMNGTALMTCKSLAGYMSTANNRQLIFAIFVNNAHLGEGITTKTFGDDLGKICELVYLTK